MRPPPWKDSNGAEIHLPSPPLCQRCRDRPDSQANYAFRSRAFSEKGTASEEPIVVNFSAPLPNVTFVSALDSSIQKRGFTPGDALNETPQWIASQQDQPASRSNRNIDFSCRRLPLPGSLVSPKSEHIKKEEGFGQRNHFNPSGTAVSPAPVKQSPSHEDTYTSFPRPPRKRCSIADIMTKYHSPAQASTESSTVTASDVRRPSLPTSSSTHPAPSPSPLGPSVKALKPCLSPRLFPRRRGDATQSQLQHQQQKQQKSVAFRKRTSIIGTSASKDTPAHVLWDAKPTGTASLSSTSSVTASTINAISDDTFYPVEKAEERVRRSSRDEGAKRTGDRKVHNIFEPAPPTTSSKRRNLGERADAAKKGRGMQADEGQSGPRLDPRGEGNIGTRSRPTSGERSRDRHKHR